MSRDGTGSALRRGRENSRGSRRRLLTLLGVGGAAALGSQVAADGAWAGHGSADDLNALHLGQSNAAPPGTETGVEADINKDALLVRNIHTGAESAAVRALASGQKPTITVENDGGEGGAAVVGASCGPGFGEAGHFGDGSGTGVRGISGTGIGVEAVSAGGLALAVRGRAHFQTAGAESVFVSNPAAVENSHVVVTLTSDPGPRVVRWVQRHVDRGFTVHLSSAPPRSRPRTTLTYLIIETPAG